MVPAQSPAAIATSAAPPHRPASTAPADVPGRMWPTHLNDPVRATTSSDRRGGPRARPALLCPHPRRPRACTRCRLPRSLVAPPAPRRAGEDSCTCRIQGTVEVEWDWPLPAKTPVTISIEGLPALRDVAELFMSAAARLRADRRAVRRPQAWIDSRSRLGRRADQRHRDRLHRRRVPSGPAGARPQQGALTIQRPGSRT